MLIQYTNHYAANNTITKCKKKCKKEDAEIMLIFSFHCSSDLDNANDSIISFGEHDVYNHAYIT